MKRKRKPRFEIFGDVVELEYVLSLVREYAEIETGPFSPDELKLLSADNVLLILEKKLQDALKATGFPAGELYELHPLCTLTNQQDAYHEALRFVHFNPDPGDWTEKKLDNFDRQLRKIHGIEGDAARDANQGRSVGGKKTAKQLKSAVAERDAKLTTAAIQLRARNKNLSYSDMAYRLAQRGYGNADYLRKKLRKMLHSCAK